MAVSSPREKKAMRRAAPGAAVAQAKAASPAPNTLSVVNIGGAPSPPAEAMPSPVSPGGAEAMSESLHGMRQYTVRRHPKGAITLHRHDDQFLLVARAEGGGISTFWRLYSEPALTGMTPGKGASSYIGKVEGDGLYLRRGKKSPKACSLEFRYGKKALPDGTRQLAVLVPPAAAGAAAGGEELVPGTPTWGSSPMQQSPAPPPDPASRRGWLQLASIPPLFSTDADASASFSAADADMPSLGSPVPGLLASVKNLALREEAPMSAANAGFGGGSSGGWVGAGGREPRGPAAEAECALRLGKVKEDEYMLLCGPPLSALQAFAVAVSSLAH